MKIYKFGGGALVFPIFHRILENASVFPAMVT